MLSLAGITTPYIFINIELNFSDKHHRTKLARTSYSILKNPQRRLSEHLYVLWPTDPRCNCRRSQQHAADALMAKRGKNDRRYLAQRNLEKRKKKKNTLLKKKQSVYDRTYIYRYTWFTRKARERARAWARRRTAFSRETRKYLLLLSRYTQVSHRCVSLYTVTSLQ